MHKFPLSLTIATALLLVPASAGAYMSPEDVFFTSGFGAPPSPRTAEQRAEEQRSLSATRRAEALSELHGAAGEEKSATTSGGEPDFLDIQQIIQILKTQKSDRDPASTTPLPDDLSGSEDVDMAGEEWADDNTMTTLSAREERILDRIAQNQANALRGSAPMETLHSGAPLSHTGPGLVIAGTAFVCGALWTIRKTAKRAAYTQPL